MKVPVRLKVAMKALLLLVLCVLPVLAGAQDQGEKKVEKKSNIEVKSGAAKGEQPKKEEQTPKKEEDKGSQVDLWLTQKIYRARHFFVESIRTPPGESRAFESTFNPYILDFIKENCATNAWDDPRIRLDIRDGDLIVTQTENVHKRLEEFLAKTITKNRGTQIIFDWQVVIIDMRDARKILERAWPSVTAQTKVFPWIGNPVIADTGHYYTLVGKGQAVRRDGWMRTGISPEQIQALSSALKKSKRAKMACNVRLPTINGKTARYDLSRRVNFVSHFEQPPLHEGKRTVLVPAIGSVRTGMWFDMCGFLNDDRTSATIYFHPTLCNLLSMESLVVKAKIEYITSDKGKPITQELPAQMPVLVRRTGVLKAQLRNNQSMLAIGLTNSVDKDKKLKTELVLILLNVGIATGNL